LGEKAVIVDPVKVKKKLPNLAFCILLDAIGCLNYALPVFGEAIDIIWAPVSALLFLAMFGGRIGKIGAILNFIEEIVPFTDIIPSFTIAYFIRKQENQ
jgi:hypothetical protein